MVMIVQFKFYRSSDCRNDPDKYEHTDGDFHITSAHKNKITSVAAIQSQPTPGTEFFSEITRIPTAVPVIPNIDLKRLVHQFVHQRPQFTPCNSCQEMTLTASTTLPNPGNMERAIHEQDTRLTNRSAKAAFEIKPCGEF